MSAAGNNPKSVAIFVVRMYRSDEVHTVGAREGRGEGDDGEETTEGHIDTGEEGECSEL